MFHAAKNLLEDDYEGHVIRTLIQHNISLIAAHTNLDQSPVYSGSAVLAELDGSCTFSPETFTMQVEKKTGTVFGELPDTLVFNRE